MTVRHVDDPSRDNTGFAAELRAGTQGEHEATEGSTFMADLVAGKVPKELYARYVAQLWCVYRELEDVARSARLDPVAAPFVFDELERTPLLEADLDALLGEGWAWRRPSRRCWRPGGGSTVAGRGDG